MGAANDLLLPGFLLTGVFLAWELQRSARPGALLVLVGVALLGGVIVDGGYALASIVAYRQPAGPLAPWWILGLWIIFSLTLTESMGWMQQRRLIGSLMAGVAAPMSYFAGYKLGAITFPSGFWTAMAVAAVTWMPAIFGLITLANRLLPPAEKPTAAP